jgi:hypothetical protein
VNSYIIKIAIINFISLIVDLWKEKKNKLSALQELLRNIRLLLKSPMVKNVLYPDVMAKLIKKTTVGSKIFELCAFSDSLIY